jgi:DNA invertase Pin-like site-specific DNA recombinase
MARKTPRPSEVAPEAMIYWYARVSTDGQSAEAQVRQRRAAGARKAWADSTTSHGRSMLTVFDGLAEFERDLIRARTGEGRARAVTRAENGPTAKITPHQKREAIERRDQGEESLGDIGRSYNVSPATISRLTA